MIRLDSFPISSLIILIHSQFAYAREEIVDEDVGEETIEDEDNRRSVLDCTTMLHVTMNTGSRLEPPRIISGVILRRLSDVPPTLTPSLLILLITSL